MKTKKKMIKLWGRGVYYGVLKGIYILMNYPLPKLPEQITKPDDFKDMPDHLKSRYANKPVNPKYYGTIKIEGL